MVAAAISFSNASLRFATLHHVAPRSLLTYRCCALASCRSPCFRGHFWYSLWHSLCLLGAPLFACLVARLLLSHLASPHRGGSRSALTCSLHVALWLRARAIVPISLPRAPLPAGSVLPCGVSGRHLPCLSAPPGYWSSSYSSVPHFGTCDVRLPRMSPRVGALASRTPCGSLDASCSLHLACVGAFSSQLGITSSSSRVGGFGSSMVFVRMGLYEKSDQEKRTFAEGRADRPCLDGPWTVGADRWAAMIGRSTFWKWVVAIGYCKSVEWVRMGRTVWALLVMHWVSCDNVMGLEALEPSK